MVKSLLIIVIAAAIVIAEAKIAAKRHYN